MLYVVYMKLGTLFNDSITQNSFYPVVGSGLMAGLGFIFWLIVARIHPDADVGIAATLISTLTAIATLALVGFDTTIIRFLAHEPRKHESITTGMLLVGIAATVLSVLFIISVAHIAPVLADTLATPYTRILFVSFAVLATLNLYTDAIFLAYRATKRTFIKNILFSVLKIAFPFLLVPYGAFGIFSATACAYTIGFAYGLTVLIRSFGYRPCMKINGLFLARTWKYSIGNYIANTLNFLPLTLLPILIIQTLGSERSAHYHIVMMVAGLLFTVPTHTMNALFAEVAHTEHAIRIHLRRALLVTMALLIPGILILILAGPLLLSLFGKTYTTHGATFLTLMVINALAVFIFSLHGTIFRIEQDTRALIIRNAVYTATLFVSVPLLLTYNLTGVGIAYVASTLFACAIGHALFLIRSPHYVHGKILRQQLSISNLWKAIVLLLQEEVLLPTITYVTSKYAYIRARRKGVRTTIHFFPEQPHTYHILYRTCHELGWKMVATPQTHADIHFHFEDATYKTTSTRDINAYTQPVINGACTDISKTHVDEVCMRIFGYSMRIDPRTTSGTCVRKSERNAQHDGTILTCPCEPEKGYVYQTFIDTRDKTGRPNDLRIPVFGDNIPFVLKRYKSPDDIFNQTVDVHFMETHEALTADEQRMVLAFSRALGLDYGELDALRSGIDGRLYIVDANDTPAGPIGPIRRDTQLFMRWRTEIREATRTTILN